jgi:type III secretion protein L
MAKVIKGTGAPVGTEELGTLSPDAGLADVRKKSAIVSREEFDAVNDARKIVADAQQRASQIIADAEQQAEQISQAAQAEAFELRAGAHEQGFKEGADEAGAKYLQVIAEHSQRMEKKEGEVASQIRQLSLAIAKKIIGKELQLNPQAIVEMAKKHLQSIRQRREVYLRVSPSDLENLKAQKRELIDQLGRAKEIELRADEALSPGSMFIETEAGTIDARLETQLAVIERVLMGKPPL